MLLAGLLRRALPDAAITLVSTPRNVAALRVGDAAAPRFLSFHALPFTPSDHGLPPHSESVDALPPGRVVDLMVAFEVLQPAFDDYLAAATATAAAPTGGGRARVIVVSDVFTAWTVDVARLHGCAHAVFVSRGAFGSAVLHSPPSLPLFWFRFGIGCRGTEQRQMWRRGTTADRWGPREDRGLG
jgi:hypothetical protein